jgi:hypothetical protein
MTPAEKKRRAGLFLADLQALAAKHDVGAVGLSLWVTEDTSEMHQWMLRAEQAGLARLMAVDSYSNAATDKSRGAVAPALAEFRMNR